MWFKTTQLKSSKQRLGGAMVDLGMSWTCILRRRSCFGGVKPLWASSLMNDDGDDDEEEEMTMAMTTTLFWFTMKRLLLTDSFQVFKLFHDLEQPMTQPFLESPPPPPPTSQKSRQRSQVSYQDNGLTSLLLTAVSWVTSLGTSDLNFPRS